MTLTPMHFLIVCPLVALAGFVDSIAGGGGLISLPAYLLTGLPVHACIATNKLSSPMGTLVSTIRYAREGYIDWRLGAFCAAGALAGAAIGANIALLISDTVFRWLMLVILPLTAAYVLRGRALSQDAPATPALPFWRSALSGTLISLLVGMYDGLYGPGAGTFLLLLLSRFGHMDLRRANGVTKVANLSSNVASLAVYLMNGQVLLPLGLCAGLFSIAGNALGSRCFTKRGADIARPVILLVLTLFFARTALELLGVL